MIFCRRRKFKVEATMTGEDGKVVCAGQLAGMGSSAMKRRVVITGLGVVAPNATGVPAFDAALRATQSGLRTVDFMVKHGFACTVGGIPQGVDELAKKLFTEEELIAMNAIHRYAAVAAVEAWEEP